MRSLLVMALLIGLAGSARGDGHWLWSDSGLVDVNSYGHCSVWTQVHILTEEASYALRCRVGTIDEAVGMTIIQWHTGILESRLRVGFAPHFASTITVAYRIDKGEVRRGQWLWIGGGCYCARTEERDVAIALLRELHTARQIAIQVGKRAGRIPLTEIGAAVDDFIARVNQTANSR